LLVRACPNLTKPLKYKCLAQKKIKEKHKILHFSLK
jgi:hypothetical protein